MKERSTSAVYFGVFFAFATLVYQQYAALLWLRLPFVATLIL
jgi:hypothetical protein